MAIERHVWSFAEAEVQIYQERPTIADYRVGEIYGTPVGIPPTIQPVLPYCFLEGATLRVSTVLVRRGTTNRGRRKIINPANAFDEIQLTVDHLYFRKSSELDTANIFNARKQLRLVLINEDWLYSDVYPFENDRFTLSFAYANNFQITGRRADVMEGSAEFLAEALI